jgi:hypothetical protein
MDGIPPPPQLLISGTAEGTRRYRLNSTTIAEKVAILIPRVSVLDAGADSVDATCFVTVEWDGNCVQMFGIDLKERGELILEWAASAVDPNDGTKAHDCDPPRPNSRETREVRDHTHLSATEP